GAPQAGRRCERGGQRRARPRAGGGPAPGRDPGAGLGMYAFLRWVMRTITRTYLVGGLFRVEGRDLVPRSAGLLVCANHSSTVDPPMVPAFFPRTDTWSMAKAEWFQVPWKHWLFTNYHAFPLVRHTADRRAIRHALGLLADGQCVVIYPEGTRVR